MTLRFARLLALCAPCTLGACFLGYDSRWGQARAAQQHNAKASTPNALRSEDGELASPAPGQGLAKPAHRLSVRVYATRRYAAATVDWQKQFDEVVAAANPTLRYDFDSEISVAAYELWASAESDDDLSGMVDALRRRDPGSDVDWVIGLASAVPVFAQSPDQLGVGALTGKHVVMRAMSDVQEYDAIQRAFPDLGEDERRRLYSARKLHKAAGVLLHELGHTLGMPHELLADTVMNARYSPKESDFSERAIEIGKLTLAFRRHEDASLSEPAWASRLLNLIRAAPDASWEPVSREQLVALLSARSALPSPVRQPAAQPAPANGPPNLGSQPSAGAQTSELAELSEPDRARFRSAQAAKTAGDPGEAARRAAPLFSAYPNVYAVQNLRCELAMAQNEPWQATQRECEALMRMTPSLGAPAR